MSALEDTVRAIVREELATALKGSGETPAPAPAKRGRGRPVVGETVATVTSAAPVAAAVAIERDDPFAEQKPAVPTVVVTQAEVRAALVKLKNATSEENALLVLAAAGEGAPSLPYLKPEKYGAVIEAVEKALAKPATPAVQESDDPFATTETKSAEPVPSFEEIKALIVETQKRASADTVQQIVMKHGGKGPKADGSGEGPSLKALPVSAYLAVAAELKALPKTK